MSQAKESTTNSETKKNEAQENKKPAEIDPEDKWMIRDCEIYKDEYNECTSFRGRFHQYFIYGESLDCNQWKHDYNNCCKWTDDNDVKAAEAVINSEQARRMKRFRAHYSNNTWKKRESPPSDWDKPLPEWLLKRDENSYLGVKAKELREGKVEEDSGGFCSIM